MVGRESQGGSVFSWADEVEKEEEAAAGSGQPQLRQKQKPNPFGSARPREVVLQEKGIDWRKLDLHLQQSPPLWRDFQNEKLRKQRKPPTAITILNSKQPVRFRGSPTVSPQPQVIPTSQIQSPIVPPLRFPPKYVAGLLFEPGVFTTPKALYSGYQHFEKENRSEGGGNFRNLNSESAMRGNTRRTTTELVQAKEAQQRGRILREAVVYGNKPDADSATRKEKFHCRDSPGLPLVNQNIGPSEIRDKRMPASGRQLRNNMQDDLVVDGTAFQVAENKTMELKWQKVTRKKPQDLSIKKVKNVGRDTAHRKVKGRNNKKNYEKKEMKLHT